MAKNNNIQSAVVVTNVAELVTILTTAKAGGQYVALYGETPVRVNKYPNGTKACERKTAEPFDTSLNPTKGWHIKYHFGEDYERKMAKALGLDAYDADGGGNRIHLVPNVLMQYVSTGNVCVIAMPEDRHKDGLLCNGVPATTEQAEYIARYEQASKSSGVVDYLTIGVKNVRKMVVGKTTYHLALATPSDTPTYAVAVAR